MNLAKKLYEAYRAHTDGKSLATGQDIPIWKDLSQEIKEAWLASAEAAKEISKSKRYNDGHKEGFVAGGLTHFETGLHAFADLITQAKKGGGQLSTAGIQAGMNKLQQRRDDFKKHHESS